MARQDDSGETFSKSIGDWLTRVGGIATVLATIFALFFPNLGDDAKRLAYAAAILLLVGSSAVYYFQRRRTAREKAAQVVEPSVEELEPSAQTAVLRGPIPFEEGDQLPLRGRDVQQLYTYVASSASRLVVLRGESGCGKTSLLRAGLLPILRKNAFRPVYVPTPTKEPLEAIRIALEKESPGSGQGKPDLRKRLSAAAPKGKKVVIILDQFEEFFLSNPTPKSRASFVNWMDESSANANFPVVLLLCVRESSFAELQGLASFIHERIALTTCRLQSLDVQQAKQILIQAAKTDAAPFEPAVIEALVRDVQRGGLVRPAELQIAATRLKQKNFYTLDKYAFANRRVLMIVFNPVADKTTGKTLIETLGWANPNALAEEYLQDIQECSDGLVNYQIVDRDQFLQHIEVDEFPLKTDGTRFQPVEYLDAISGKGDASLLAGFIDYGVIIKKFNLLERVANREFDEVWLFGFPGAGLFQSTMAGKGAFFCNSDPVPNTEKCPRRFMILGFSYERGVGEMLEGLGHQAEQILARVFHSEAFLMRSYASQDFREPTPTAPSNLFERFVCFDQIAPGKSGVGNIHYAPNSERDYDWGNMRRVSSFCDDWYNFPNMTGAVRTVDAREWGSGDMRLHHKWWLSHLPRSGGSTDGIENNWWKYVVDPNSVPSEKQMWYSFIVDRLFAFIPGRRG